MDDVRLWRLATYNAEVGRGIVHTGEWKIFMREEQAVFDSEPRPVPRKLRWFRKS